MSRAAVKPQSQPAATPDNTPIPGGGRWRWDTQLPGWVEVSAEPADAPEPAPVDPDAAIKE